LNFSAIDVINKNHNFSTIKKSTKTGTHMIPRAYPLFFVACFYYFYYDIVLVNIKAGRI